MKRLIPLLIALVLFAAPPAHAVCGHATLSSTATTILPAEPFRHGLCIQNTATSGNAEFSINNNNLPIWQASHVYALGTIINDGTNIQRCSTAGTSGTTAPSWATTAASTTTDNTITWTVMQVGVAAVAADFLLLPTSTSNQNASFCFPNPQEGVMLPGGAVSAISASASTVAWCSW